MVKTSLTAQLEKFCYPVGKHLRPNWVAIHGLYGCMDSTVGVERILLWGSRLRTAGDDACVLWGLEKGRGYHPEKARTKPFKMEDPPYQNERVLMMPSIGA